MFTFTISYMEAMKIAKKIAHSMSKEETRYYLNGFFMNKAGDGKLYAVSTDGHRLTRIRFEAEYKGEFPAFIMPAQAVKQLEAIKMDAGNRDKARVTFEVHPKAFTYTIKAKDVTLGGKLIDATYPDWQLVIPSGWESFAGDWGDFTLSAPHLADICKAASYNAQFFNTKLTVGIRIFFSATGGPAVITESDKSVLYVLMPTHV